MMLTISFKTTILAIFQILLMGACGYVLVRKKVIEEAGLDLLIRLLMNFFMPLFIFYQLTQNFSFEEYRNWWIFPLISFGVTLCGIIASQIVLCFNREFSCRKEFISLIVFQNSGYLPLILIATLLEGRQAETMFVYIFLFLIGFNFTMWSLGVLYLSNQEKDHFHLRKLFNPPLVVMLISLFIIYFKFHYFIPQAVLKPIKMFSDCVLPLAMIMVGGSLARIKMTDVKVPEIATVVFTKLILLPLFALGIIYLFNIDFLIGLLIILETVAPSAVSLSIIARHYKIEESIINHGLLFSHLICVITIPVFLYIYFYLRSS